MKALQENLSVFLRVLGIIAAVEILVMIIMPYLPVPTGIWTVAVDSTLLAVISAPLLYLGLIRGLNREIERRRQAEENLSKASREWALTFDSMVDGVSIHSKDYEIVNVNLVLCDMLGKTREELIGRKCHEIFHLKDSPIAECPLARTRNSRHREFAEIFEETIGNGVWLSVATAPIFDENGEIKNIIHVIRDISERKKAEAALAEAHHHNELILNNAGEGIYGVDSEGRVTFINSAAASTMGYAPDEAIGRSSHALWHHTRADGTPWPAEECTILSTAKTGIPHSVTDDIYWRANGTSFPVEYVSSGIMDNGTCMGAVVIFRDVTEKKEAEKKIQHQMEDLAALHEIDLAITTNIDLGITLKVILTQVVEQLAVDAADILLLDPHLNALELVAARGFRTDTDGFSTLDVARSVAGRAVLGHRMVCVLNVDKAEDNIARAPLFTREGFITYHAIPLHTKGQVKGVLEVYHRKRFFPDDNWRDFFKALATQAAIAIDNAGLFENLQRSNSELVMAYDKTLEGWSRAMDLRDKETEGHTRRVSEMTVRMGRAMKMNDAELIHLYRGALLHDVGKLGIPDNILLKPGKLNEDEWHIMKLHPKYAYELLSPISYLRPAIDIPYCHHEMWDGSGYPRGLTGEQIPLPARIFAVIDVWDALRSDRPYRLAWPEEKVREHITSLAGTHFDPHVVKTFMELDPTFVS